MKARTRVSRGAWLLAGVLLLSGAYSVWLLWTHPLDEDEMYQLHQGWEIASGYVPFADFDAFNVCTATIASLGFRVAGNRFAGVLLDKGLALSFYLAVCFLVFRIGALVFSRRAGLAAVFAWMSLGHVVMKSAEFRPIHFSLFFSLAALSLYLADTRARRRRGGTFFAVGALCAAAFLLKPDSIIMPASILLVETGSRVRALDRAWLREMLLVAAGGLCVLLLFLAALGDPDRVWRYLFFQYRFLVFVASIVETTWVKRMVFRFEFAVPLATAALVGAARLAGRLRRPGFGVPAAWMAVYGALALLSLWRRPIYYQHNLFFPSLVPVLLAGFGLDFLLRHPRRALRAAGWGLAGAMVLAGAVSVYRWNHQGILRSKAAFHARFERAFAPEPVCTLPAHRVFEAGEIFREEKPVCKLDREDHRRLLEFLVSLRGERLTVYDGFEAALPVRGASCLNGFVLNAFHETKYQQAYDLIRQGDGFLLERMLASGWRMFQDMTPESAWDALVRELETNPPAVLMVDSFVWRLADSFPGYRAFLEARYEFVLVSGAHSIVGLRKGAAALPAAAGPCGRGPGEPPGGDPHAAGN